LRGRSAAPERESTPRARGGYRRCAGRRSAPEASRPRRDPAPGGERGGIGRARPAAALPRHRAERRLCAGGPRSAGDPAPDRHLRHLDHAAALVPQRWRDREGRGVAARAGARARQARRADRARCDERIRRIRVGRVPVAAHGNAAARSRAPCARPRRLSIQEGGGVAARAARCTADFRRHECGVLPEHERLLECHLRARRGRWRGAGSMRTALAMQLLTAAVLVACRAPSPAGADLEPSVKGANVLIPLDSPQNKVLAIHEAREARPAPLHLNGRLAWDENVSVRMYSAFSGRVTEVLAQPGQRVASGAILARIASSEYAKAESDAHKAASKLRLAERTLARVRDLEEHGAAAMKELEVAEAERAAAASEDQRARAGLAAYGDPGNAVDGSFALRAPIAGVVVERNLSPGQEVRNDQIMAGTPQLAAPLFTITDPSRLWVLIDASEHDASQLQPGDPFSVQLYLDHGAARAGRIETVS